MSNPRLLDRIRAEIRTGGPLSFARFMALALHDPDDGYYAGGAGRLGPSGDFFTASDVGPVFGRCLARQLAEIDRAIDRPAPFHAVELGAGRGLLARDILDARAELGEDLQGRLRYTMVDRSPAMRAAAAELNPAARVLDPDELDGRHDGCVLAIELFDALPVHRLRRREGKLSELAVGLDDEDRLVEIERRPAAAASALAERYGAASDDGTEAEVCPQALDQIDAIDRILRRGVVLIVDYGDAADRLYTAERPRGTLLAYSRHATSEAFLESVGEQDLTAHVNFSALEDRAVELGWSVLGRTTQDRFLVANGIVGEFEATDEAGWHDPRRVRQRLQAKQLIHPSGMGRAFKVLLLSKGCDPAPLLRGLDDPFAR